MDKSVANYHPNDDYLKVLFVCGSLGERGDLVKDYNTIFDLLKMNFVSNGIGAIDTFNIDLTIADPALVEDRSNFFEDKLEREPIDDVNINSIEYYNGYLTDFVEDFLGRRKYLIEQLWKTLGFQSLMLAMKKLLKLQKKLDVMTLSVTYLINMMPK